MNYTKEDHVRDILSAIKSTKARMSRAEKEGRKLDVMTAFAELITLENCLVTQSAILVRYDMEEVA